MARTKAEIGAPGLPLFSGRLSLDLNPKLRGAQGAKVYREMMSDDPACAAFVAACNTLFRADLQVTAGGQSAADEAAAEFVESCFDDMRDSLDMTLRRAFSFVPYGWSIMEFVFKRRDDGRVGWSHWGVRRQETLDKWETDAQGRITGFTQRVQWPTIQSHTIPLRKCLHVVADDSDGSPEGKAALRPMYKPAYFAKNLELLWAISLERFGTGVPVFELRENVTTALTEDQINALEAIAAGLRQNEEAYVITPPGIAFRFEPSPGLDADKYRSAILFFRTWALATGLAEFITLGTGDTGSYALGESKIELFLKAMTGYQDRLCEAINRQAIPLLMRYNNLGRLTEYPRVSLPAVRQYDLERLGNFTRTLHDVGAFHPTVQDEEMFRKISDLADIDRETLDDLYAQDEQLKEQMAQVAAQGMRATGQDESRLVDDDDDPNTKELAIDE
jgi:hypothetical protein